MWQHVKKFTAVQDGRQVYRTLRSHFFGADKVNIMVNNILSSLKSKVYQGDRKNFNFDKHCLAHVEQHNCHASLVEYGVPALEESMKIHYFEEGIKDPTLDAARNAILVNRLQLLDFDSIMQLYVTSKPARNLKPLSFKDDTSPPSRAVVVEAEAGPAAVVAVGVTPSSDREGLFLKLTSTRSLLLRTSTTPKKSVYAKFSAAEKAKHWQLRNPGKECGTGPNGGKKTGISATNVSGFASDICLLLSKDMTPPLALKPMPPLVVHLRMMTL